MHILWKHFRSGLQLFWYLLFSHSLKSRHTFQIKANVIVVQKFAFCFKRSQHVVWRYLQFLAVGECHSEHFYSKLSHNNNCENHTRL